VLWAAYARGRGGINVFLYDYCARSDSNVAHSSICSYATGRGTTQEDATVAITIRNKALESQIREWGSESGEGPSGVIQHLVHKEQERRAALEAAAIQEKRRAVKEWLDSLPPVTDEDRAEIQRIMDDMYDEDGLPK
jgi:hypothetical protein